MATNQRIQTTELDFDTLKQSLKNFLQGQTQFSDYDFEGSGLSVLLDVLAYNTHYNALYTNLAVNEAFLDSASKRASVVSKAKELGYVPHSAKAAVAIVDVTMINNLLTAPASIELPKYTPFNTQVEGTSYVFYSKETRLAYRVDNQYTFNDLELIQGTPLEFRFTIETAATVGIIPNANVDLSTMQVTVQENSQSATSSTYTRSTNIINVDGNSLVYYVHETEGGNYQIEFGNDVVGKALSAGNVVTVQYFACDVDAPNGAQTFTYAGGTIANTQIYINTTTAAFGGVGPESIDSVKWNAPRAYAAQNRCITPEDYSAVIKQLFPGIEAINVWGGEENTPPIYGKVFISIVPLNPEEGSDLLTDEQKDYIIDYIIAPRKALTVTPEIVDPQYIDIELSTTFYYNANSTTRTTGDLTTLVGQTINAYGETYLNTFGSVFKYSKISALIDLSEPAITSNITSIKLRREISPVFNSTAAYTIQLGNPIYNSGVAEESVITTGFFTPGVAGTCFIDDLPPTNGSTTGTLRLFTVLPSGVKSYVQNIGTVNYSTGQIAVVGLNILGLATPSWQFVIKPQSNDVVSTQNQFIRIDPNSLSINAVIDDPTKPYTFTSSRN